MVNRLKVDTISNSKKGVTDNSCKEFFNPEYRGSYIVRDFIERDKIPCELRMNGLSVTIIEDFYSEWQLQIRNNESLCDNNNWVKIDKGTKIYDGSNLFIFSSIEQSNEYLKTDDAKEGQLIYITNIDKYYKVSDSLTLIDPFPEKLNKPEDTTQLEDGDLLIPVYKNGLPPLWKFYSDFGKVHTVNNLKADSKKNINIGMDEILSVGPPKLEDTLNSIASTKRVLLYDPKDNKAYWKKVSEIGKINTVDGIGPVAGNVDLSSRYFTKTEIKDGFVAKPSTYSIDQDLDIVLQNSSTGESFKIRLGDVPNLKAYYSPDNTLTIEDDVIYLNVSNLRFDTEVLNYNQNMLPLDIQGNQDFAEITDVVVNGEPLPSEMFRLTSKRSITILENYTELTAKYNQQPNKLYVTIKGIKFFNK